MTEDGARPTSGATGGERDLRRLLAGMRPELDGERWVFAVLPPGAPPAPALGAVATVREAEGWTAIVPLASAERAGLRHDDPYRRITLTVHSSLAAVGFLAAVARVLADAAIPCNVVSGAYHDHLFVPAHQADEALDVLTALSARARPGAS